MADPLATISTRATPQSEQADPRQVKNSAGGFAFTVDDATRLRRFLTLGVDGGTYYASEHELAKSNADVVLRWARERCTELVDEIVAISVAGRAPRQNPALFALAAACSLGDDAGRTKALGTLSKVARTGTHLFLFARYVEQFRGWGRGLRRSVSDWYLDKPVDKLAYQMVKYRQREGWSHRDLLRLAHPPAIEDDRRALFDWACGRETSDLTPAVPQLLEAFTLAQKASTARDWVQLIGECPSLSWEMLPDAALNEPAVWEALIAQGIPQTALMRQLPRLTRLGVLAPLSPTTVAVADQLADQERLRKARVHPVNVLVAQRTYASGQSARGGSEWHPVRDIVDALDAAFYAAFGAVEPAGKRTLLALDASRSMTMSASGLPISCREASAALSLVTAATEPSTMTVGFTSGGSQPNLRSHGLTELPISPRQRLDDAIRAVSNLPFGGTDCALPMVWALQNKLEIEAFVVFTDNETWAGRVHPHQALRRYRERMGIDARLIVVGMTATEVSIADPTDPGMLDIAGFDSAVPNLIADFSRGAV